MEGKHLSFAGRSTLIKAVAQAMPTYIMSCFLLPKNLCSHIEKMVCNYWWGNNPDKKKIHWLSWSKICKNKNKGGLGFRGIRAFNEALLAKQGWKCITQPDSLLSKMFQAKYYSKSSFLKAKPGQNMSYTWQSILKASWILKKGGLWTGGNGANINIWADNWLPDQEGHKIWSPRHPTHQQELVKDLILTISKTWNRGLIQQIFHHFEAQQILKIPLIDMNCKDEFCWPKTNDGNYTVKLGYQAIQDWQANTREASTSNTNSRNPVWETLWKQMLPPKHLHLVWRVIQNALPVCNNLNSRGINCSPLCPRCNKKLEDITHVFQGCDWAKQVWFASQLNINFDNAQYPNFSEWLQNVIPYSSKEVVEQICAICYHIWKARNMLVFRQREIPVMETLV
jgi:hypothetical protein